MAKPFVLPPSKAKKIAAPRRNMLITELLKLIPPDTKNQVSSAYKEYNMKIRGVLNDANLRLSMQWESMEKRYNCRCPVSVDEIGYPKEIVDEITIDYEYRLAALLSLYIPSLINLKQSSHDVWVALGCDPLGNLVKKLLEDKMFGSKKVIEEGRVLENSINILKYSEKLTSLLYETVQNYSKNDLDGFDLVQSILSVDRDILGIFSYKSDQDQYDKDKKYFSDYADNYNADIKLYWGIIGLVSCALNVNISGLTIVVLAHELAHAYTHLGFDRDGVRWDGHGFRDSEHKLKEGLAQYYTAIVVKRFPEAQKAYNVLLPKQPSAYRSHVKWLSGATPEAIGSALAIIRRQGAVTYEKFDQEVQQIVCRLNR